MHSGVTFEMTLYLKAICQSDVKSQRYLFCQGRQLQ